jgi:hypothetical protein
MFHKVLELESVNDVLTPVATYYFCSEQCMDAFLPAVQRLWSEVASPHADAKTNVCSKCGGKLEVGH